MIELRQKLVLGVYACAGENRLTGTQKARERVQEQAPVSVSDAALVVDGAPARLGPATVQVVRLRPPARQTSWSTWFLSPAVFLLAAGTTFLVFSFRTASVTASTPRISPLFDPRSGSLEMRVDTQGPGLRLSWNRYSPAVQAAKSGVLQIDDGREHREFALDRNQIVNGSIVYRPVSDDVSFRLDLRDSHGVDVAQILRVLDASPRTPAPESEAAAKPSLSTAANQPGKNIHQNTPKEEPRKATAIVPESGSDARNLSPRPGTAAANVPQSVGQNAAVLTAAAAFAPPPSGPTLASDAPRTADRENALTEPPEPQRNQGLYPTQTVKLPTLNPQPNPQLASPAAAPPAQPVQVAAYVPPRPLRWVQPDERLVGTPSSAVPVDVRVKVKIDETGHVTAAHALIDGGRRDKKLMAAAAAAARQWVFEPAKVRGTNVPTEEIIVIHLGPEAQ